MLEITEVFGNGHVLSAEEQGIMAKLSDIRALADQMERLIKAGAGVRPELAEGILTVAEEMNNTDQVTVQQLLTLDPFAQAERSAQSGAWHIYMTPRPIDFSPVAA